MTMQTIIKILKLIVVSVALGFVFWKLSLCWDSVAAYKSQMQPAWLTGAVLLSILANLPCAYYWHIVLNRLGQRPNWLDTIRAHYIGHLGKYTPGKALVVIMRTEMIRGPNVKASIAAVSVFFETFTMMAAGAFLAGCILIFVLNGHPRQFEIISLAIISLVVSILPIVPPFFRFIVKKIGVGKNDPEITETLKRIDFRTLAMGWGLMFVTWILFGLSLWMSVRGISLNPGWDTLPILTAAATLSVVLGFVSMLPGGIGVRESVLILLLVVFFQQSFEMSETESAAAAIVVAAMQRFISIIGELLASAVLYRTRKALDFN